MSQLTNATVVRSTEYNPRPWVVVSPKGVMYIGINQTEKEAWMFALGYPSPQEVDAKKAEGWYAATATVTWQRPDGATVQKSEEVNAY